MLTDTTRSIAVVPYGWVRHAGQGSVAYTRLRNAVHNAGGADLLLFRLHKGYSYTPLWLREVHYADGKGLRQYADKLVKHLREGTLTEQALTDAYTLGYVPAVVAIFEALQ